MKMSQEIQEKELLSLFFLYFTCTYPGLPVSAHPRVCVSWGEKEERSPPPIPSVRPTFARFATCCVLLPTLAIHPNVAFGPTRPIVTYPPRPPHP